VTAIRRREAATSWQGKQVVVVGLGGTGLAAARLLLHDGASVLVSEAGPETEHGDAAAELRLLGADCEFGGHSIERFTAADAVVISPGVPQSIESVRAAGDAGIRVISELEMAFEFARSPIIAVTGTNGKTTTCTLIHRMLDSSGRTAVYTGNTEMPFSEAVAASLAPEVYVIEVSSFQLELIESFRPDIGILLNVTPDHLDRYEGFDHYVATKLRLFENQMPTDFAVFNAADPRPLGVAPQIGSQKVLFDARREVETGCWAADGSIRYRLPGDQGTVCPTADVAIRGEHNIENALAACAGALLAGARPENCAAVLREFRGLEHRLETVAEIAGVMYVNDSKSTNVAALRCALMAFDKPVVLIAGGLGKGERYDTLQPLVEQHVRAMMLIGEEAATMESELGAHAQAHQTRSVEEAVRAASEIAQPGDVVLLSPGCASFDMFTNFKHRGTVFKDSVHKLETLCDAKHT